MLRPVIGILFGLLLASACGREETAAKQGPSPAPAPKSEPAKPAPVAPKPLTCFDDGRWASEACAGDGQGPPKWWGPQRWPALKLQKQGAFKDVDGHQHWSMTLVRGAKLAKATDCIEAMKQSFAPVFTEVAMLPSSQDSRASFRAKSAQHQVTVVCGSSIKKELLVNIDLRALPGTKS